MGAPTENQTQDRSVLLAFLRSLLSDGNALVSPREPNDEASQVIPVLEQMDIQARSELALACPSFQAHAALWAARILYHLCQFTACRDIGPEQIHATCRVPCPAPRNPETAWSVDLSFRHLPDVYRLAHLSQADPLVEELKELAAAWPLSSVGLPGLSKPAVDSFIEHESLRRLYADRIVASGDTSRIGYDPRVDQILRADLGVHQQLAPDLARRLQPTTS